MCFVLTLVLTQLAIVTATATAHVDSELLYAVIGYCPTPFESEGAVISVDSQSGDYHIIGRFSWPSEIFGCLYNYDPSVTFSTTTTNDTGTAMAAQKLAYLEFIDLFGMVIELDLKEAKITNTVTPTDLFFLGYVNMLYNADTQSLLGLTPSVERVGLCDDGCFQFGELTVQGNKQNKGHYQGLHDVYFKAVMDNVHYFDASNHIFYVQASYDLNFSHPCAPRDSDECLLAIDSRNGQLLSAVGPNNFTVYGFPAQQQQHSSGNAHGKAIQNVKVNTNVGPKDADANANANVNTNTDVLAFVFGFEDVCKHPYNDFAFASVNLQTATAELLSCVDHSVVVEDTEFTAFNSDGTLFAVAVGDTETTTQVLIIDSSTGKAVVNTDLPDLGRKLPAYLDLYVIWGITF